MTGEMEKTSALPEPAEIVQVGQRPSDAPMRVEDVLEQVQLIQTIMKRVMKKDEHYGAIPGCGDKPTLLKPGAEKLSMTFRLRPEYTIERIDLPNGHREYDVTCTLYSIGTGQEIAQGVGTCTSMEKKYRYRNTDRVCPKCGAEGTVIKGREEYGGGWLCFAKKGGCGAKWPDGAQEIESQTPAKTENPDLADCYNTVKKIAKKRAHVDAVLTATAASDIFTQDIEDMGGAPAETAPPKHEPENPASTATQMADIIDQQGDDAPPVETIDVEPEPDTGQPGDLYRVEVSGRSAFAAKDELAQAGFGWKAKTEGQGKALVKLDLDYQAADEAAEAVKEISNENGSPFVTIYNQRTGVKNEAPF